MDIEQANAFRWLDEHMVDAFEAPDEAFDWIGLMKAPDWRLLSDAWGSRSSDWKEACAYILGSGSPAAGLPLLRQAILDECDDVAIQAACSLCTQILRHEDFSMLDATILERITALDEKDRFEKTPEVTEVLTRYTRRMNSKELIFVTVGSYWDPISAWILRNRLADDGIDAFVVDEFVGTTYWLYANAIGGIKVQIPVNQLADAQAVIARDDSQVLCLTPRKATESDDVTCASCGSPDVQEKFFAVRVIFLLWLIIGFPIPIFSSAVECYDCGTRSGPPASFRQYSIRHLFVLTLIVACFLGVLRLTGHSWFESASTPPVNPSQ